MAITINIIAVGKSKKSAQQDLYQDYIKRLDWPVKLHEIILKNTDPAKLKQLEAVAILDKIPNNGKVIALDERGKTMSSITLSQKAENWINDGAQNLTFIIGGADGLDQTVRDRADLILSFGQLTFCVEISSNVLHCQFPLNLCGVQKF